MYPVIIRIFHESCAVSNTLRNSFVLEHCSSLPYAFKIDNQVQGLLSNKTQDNAVQTVYRVTSYRVNHDLGYLCDG